MSSDLLLLFDRHGDAIYHYHLARTGDPEAADDLTAATFVAALAGWPPAEDHFSARAWLGALAMRCLRAYLRTGRADPTPLPHSSAVPVLTRPDAGEVRWRLALAQLSQQLRRLPHDQADALALHYFAHLSLPELSVAVFHRSQEVVQRLLAAGSTLGLTDFHPPDGLPALDGTAGLPVFLRREYRAALEDALRAALLNQPTIPRPAVRLPDPYFWQDWRLRWGLLAALCAGLLAVWFFLRPWLPNLGLAVAPDGGPSPLLEPSRQPMALPKLLPERAVARLGKGQALALASGPDGRLAVGSSAGICLYARSLVEQWCRWTTAAITQVAFAPGGELLAAGSADGSVTLFTRSDGSPRATRSFGPSPLTGLGWLPGGQVVVSNLMGEVSAWDMPGGERLLWGPWRFGSTVYTLRVAGIPGSSDSAWVAVGGDAGLALLDGASGQVLRQDAPEGTVSALAFTADSRTLVAGLTDASGLVHVRQWDPTGLRVTEDWPLVDWPLAALPGALATGAGGQVAVAGPLGVTLLQPGQAQGVSLEAGPYSPLAFTAAGDSLYQTLPGGVIGRRDPSDGRQRAGTLDGYGATPRAIVWRWGEDWLNVVDSAGFLTQWNPDRPARYQQRLPFEIHAQFTNEEDLFPAVAYSGRNFLAVDKILTWVAWEDADQLLLVDMASGILVDQIAEGEARVVQAAFSPDGRYLLTGDQQGQLRLWSTAMASLQLVHEIDSLTVGSTITAIAWQPMDPKGKGGPPPMQAAVAWELMGRAGLDLLDPESSSVQRLPDLDRVAERLVWSEDGRYLAAGLGSGVAVWDVAQPALLWSSPSDPSAWVSAITISSDGLYLASGAQDITLWRLTSGERLRTVSGHTAPVTALTFGRDSRLASSDAGGIIYLWRVP